MTATLRVNADRLNLRSAATSTDDSIVAVLRKDQELELVDSKPTAAGWVRVRTPRFEGLVSKRYVSWVPDESEPAEAPLPPTAPQRFTVVPPRLNIRSVPSAAQASSIRGVLFEGQPVFKHQEAAEGWWLVEAQVGAAKVEGYVASRYLQAAEGDLGEFMVAAESGLNVRARPSTGASSTVIHVLPQGERVRKLEDVSPEWSRVRFVRDGRTLEGYAASEYLTALVELPPSPATYRVPAVDLSDTAELDSDKAWHRVFPPRVVAQRVRTAVAPADKAAQLLEVVRLLDVEHSARYAPGGGATFCNIYAYDYCYGAAVYLPRVWWNDRSLAAWSRGEVVQAKAGITLRELNANALYDWLVEWGDDFGWRRTDSLTQLQEAANLGQVGIICARRADRNRSGHIVAVVPESAGQTAVRSGGEVSEPLQSQAGRHNHQFQTTVWWEGPMYDGRGFFFADRTRDYVEI